MRTAKRGFTLIEILIVVILLGILAAISIAGFHGTTSSAREATARESLLQMRTQITAYCLHHRDVPPSGSSFVEQLTGQTNEDGQVGSGDAYRYGPYVSNIPPNALSGMRTVKVVGPAEAVTPDGSTGWLYQTMPGGFRFYANTTGMDSQGREYFSY